MARVRHSQAVHRGADGGDLNADDIAILDAGAHFTATNVEDALAELFAELGGSFSGMAGDVTYDPSGTSGEAYPIASFNVQDVIDELAADLTDLSGGLGSIAASIGRVILSNNSGGDLNAGDIVIVDPSADDSVTTTATPQDTHVVLIAGDFISAGNAGPFFYGGIQTITTTASVSRGNFAETSSTPGQATENATRRSGSFGQYMIGGTSPRVFMFGQPDP